MKEHEEELSEIFSGINSLLNGGSVVPPLFNEDGEFEDPFIEKYRLNRKWRFINLYIKGFRRHVSLKTDSSELAPRLKDDFAAKKTRAAELARKEGAHGIAQAYSTYTLADLAEEVDRKINELERNLSNYYHESPTYRRMQGNIRKLEIMRNAALEVEDTP